MSPDYWIFCFSSYFVIREGPHLPYSHLSSDYPYQTACDSNLRISKPFCFPDYSSVINQSSCHIKTLPVAVLIFKFEDRNGPTNLCYFYYCINGIFPQFWEILIFKYNVVFQLPENFNFNHPKSSTSDYIQRNGLGIQIRSTGFN